MVRTNTVPETQIVFADNQARKAAVRNMTEKGIELEYVPGARPLGKNVVIDIYQWGDCPVAVAGVSCRTVFDCLSLAEDDRYSGAVVRKCCLEYMDLTPDQREKLSRIVDITVFI